MSDYWLGFLTGLFFGALAMALVGCERSQFPGMAEDAVESGATAEDIRADCDFVEALPDGSERHTCDVWINATGPTPPK